MRTLFAAIVLFSASPVLAAGGVSSAILYLDGARLEYRVTAVKGYLEAPLPAGMVPRSLRVKPLGDCRVLRVEVAPAAPNRGRSDELASLKRRRTATADRLAALREKAEIYRSAAKSQSGRAPKKTKTNPDPVDSLRRGTDFALSRMEATGAAVRKAERELASLDARIEALGGVTDQGATARVWLSRGNGEARVACLVAGTCWTPSYEFRLSGSGRAEVTLHAGLPKGFRAGSLAVVPCTMAEAVVLAPPPQPVVAELDGIASFSLPLTVEELVDGPVPILSFTFTNTSGKNLPPGTATAYWQGEYIGVSALEGCRSDGSRSLRFGR